VNPLFLFLVVFVLVGAPAAWAENPPVQNFLTVHQLKTEPMAGVNYLVQGFVIYKHQCPSCPEGTEGICAPCPHPYMIISDNDKILTGANELDVNEMVLHMDNVEDFLLGRKYYFELQITPSDSRPKVLRWWEKVGSN